PFGQRFYVRTAYATSLAAPTTIAPDPTRKQFPVNKEQAIHAIYANIYVTDKYEGLIVIGAAPALSPNPTGRFLKRAAAFNPNGILNGARAITIAGHYAYISADAGLVVVSLEDPTKPKVTAVLGKPYINKPGVSAVQFRYAYVCDADGVKVLDVTDLGKPK